MEQKKKVVMLSSGYSSEMEEISKKHRIPIIDTTDVGWKHKISADEELIILCDKKSFFLAKKNLEESQKKAIKLIRDYDFGTSNSDDAIVESLTYRIGECVLSERINYVVDGTKAWLAPHHLELFKELLGINLKLQILSEDGNLIAEVEHGEQDGK